jgi:hypothetical protein
MPENNAEKEPLEKRVQVTMVLETRKYDADIEIISGKVLWLVKWEAQAGLNGK